jgi:hypothetical protein
VVRALREELGFTSTEVNQDWRNQPTRKGQAPVSSRASRLYESRLDTCRAWELPIAPNLEHNDRPSEICGQLL